MNVFVSGGTGLIGSYIIRRLLDDGHEVRAIIRSGSDKTLVKDFERLVDWVDGDLLDVMQLRKALNGIDLIVHSGAIVSYSPSDKDLIYKVNVEGTANLVNAALLENVPSFCHISSVAALGRDKKKPVVTEKEEFVNSSLNTNYSLSKHLAELEVYRGMEEGLNVFMINPTVVLGPGNWEKGSSQIFKYVHDNGLFYTSGTVNYVDVRDVAEAVGLLIQRMANINGERFILNAGQISYRELFHDLADIFQKRRAPFEAGLILREIAWRMGAIKSLISNGKPLITKESARISKTHFYYDNSKIKNLLQFNFRELDDTLKWSCKELLSRI